MHIDHKAGEKLFVDYAGDRLAIVDPDSGKEQPVETFVAILGRQRAAGRVGGQSPSADSARYERLAGRFPTGWPPTSGRKGVTLQLLWRGVPARAP